MTSEAGKQIGLAAEAQVIACSASRCITARERRHALQGRANGGPTELGRARSSCYTELRSQTSQFKILSVGQTGGPYGSTLTHIHRKTIGDLARTYRLPSVCLDVDLISLGHLMCYGWDRQANARLAADFVDKILRGAKAGDLPIQQPTTFRLAVNVKTAGALGLTIPPSLLLRAGQVIE